MPGPKSFREIVLSAEQRDTLRAMQASAQTPSGVARRVEIVLAAAAGVRIRVISREVGVRRDVVRKWIDRFIAVGMDGLNDLPRPGRPRVATPGTDPTDPESYNHRVPELSTARFDWSKLNPLRRAEVERALRLLGLIGIGESGTPAVTTG